MDLLIELFYSLWFLPLVGVVVGLAAGVFGIGGGALMVPVLVWVFAALGIDESLQMHMAVATSLTIIIFNAMSAIWTHYQKSALQMHILVWLFPALFIGAYVGALFASGLNAVTLKFIFAVASILIGLRLLMNQQPKPTKQYGKSEGFLHMVAGFIFGQLSAMIGIGGGTFVVPYLVWRGETMAKAVAGGAAGGLAIALAASWFNLSLPVTNTPQYSIGLVYLPAVVAIGLVSVFFARVGAKLAHRLDGAKLKRYFAFFLFFVGIKFLWQVLF